jgi:hypothetical protein
MTTEVNFISQKELQKLFDNNGLDSFSVDAKQLNIVDYQNKKLVKIDNDLYRYLSPFNFLIHDITNLSLNL